LGLIDKAKAIFATLKPDNDDIKDSYWLNVTLFDLYDKNIGIASQNFIKALGVIKNELPIYTQDDWWRFAAVVYSLNQTNWLLDILEQQGYDSILAPYFYAIKTFLAKNREGYLNSLAAEIKYPAKIIIEKIEHFL